MKGPEVGRGSEQTPEGRGGVTGKVKSGATHPMDVKMALAQEIVAGFHGASAAEKAAAEFQRIFRDREAPKEIQPIKFKRTQGGLVSLSLPQGRPPGYFLGAARKWCQVLAYLDESESISEAERIIKHGGLEINGKV